MNLNEHIRSYYYFLPISSFLQNSKVTAHWYNGTTLYMMKFEDSVIARNKQLDDR